MPLLQGIWRPRKIANPAYFKDDTPLANIGKINAAAIEIWTMDNNYYFDDIVVANDPAVAEAFMAKTWGPKHELEVGQPVAAAEGVSAVACGPGRLRPSLWTAHHHVRPAVTTAWAVQHDQHV